MPGLMARILSRRADGAPTPAEALAADQPTVVVPAQTAGEEVTADEVAAAPAPADGEADQPTTVLPAVADDPATEAAAAELDPTLGDPAAPAGVELEPPAAPSFRNRGKLRRRLRYLRRVREIAFRDLGGLVFDLDRFGRERPDLVAMKLSGLNAIDTELRALEVALDDIRAVEELQEPGISACRSCGALHGTEARFCPACGTPLEAPEPAAELPAAAPAEAPQAEAEAPAETPAPEPEASAPEAEAPAETPAPEPEASAPDSRTA